MNEPATIQARCFPEDFMFQLTKGEWGILTNSVLRSQFVINDSTENTGDSNLTSQIVISRFLDNNEQETNWGGSSNDINESTCLQLENLTTALAELQGGERKPKPRRRIGFIQDEESEENRVFD